jgi:hypothetical protein
VRGQVRAKIKGFAGKRCEASLQSCLQGSGRALLVHNARQACNPVLRGQVRAKMKGFAGKQ